MFMWNHIFKKRSCINCKKPFIPKVGNQRVCKKCKHKVDYLRIRKWVKNNPILIKQYSKNFRETHLLEIRKKDRICKKQWRKNNLAKALLQERKWRKQNAEKHRNRTSTWKKKNKDKTNDMNRKRYLKTKGITGSHTLKEWENLKAKNNSTCKGCGKKEPEIKLTRDHIIPISKGGTDYIKNIQPMCNKCNSRKWAN